MSKKVQHQALAKCGIMYLGRASADGTNTEPGTDFLQVPLRERYSDHARTSGISGSLTVFSSGVYVQQTEEPVTVTWFPMKSLFMCAALRYVDRAVDGEVGDRFIALDDPRATGSKHPPIFALAIRRQDNKDVVDCHVFLTKNIMAAMALVHSCTHAFQNKEGWTDAMPPAKLIEQELEKVKTKHNEKLSTWNENRANQSQFVSHSPMFQKGHTISAGHRVPPQQQKVPLSQMQWQKSGTISSSSAYRQQRPPPVHMQHQHPSHRMGTHHPMQMGVVAEQFPQQQYDPRVHGMRSPHPYWTISHAGQMPYPYAYGPQGDNKGPPRESKRVENDQNKGSKGLKNLFKTKEKTKPQNKEVENHGSSKDKSRSQYSETRSRREYAEFDQLNHSVRSRDHGDLHMQPDSYGHKGHRERHRDDYGSHRENHQNRSGTHKRPDIRNESKRLPRYHGDVDNEEDFNYRQNHENYRSERSNLYDPQRFDKPTHVWENEPEKDYETKRDHHSSRNHRRSDHPDSSPDPDSPVQMRRHKPSNHEDEDDYLRRRESKKDDIEKLARALAEHRIMNKTPPIDYELSNYMSSGPASRGHQAHERMKSPPIDYDENNTYSSHINNDDDDSPAADYEEVPDVINQSPAAANKVGQNQEQERPPVFQFSNEIMMRAKQMSEKRAEKANDN